MAQPMRRDLDVSNLAFRPLQPETYMDAGLSEAEVESMILKYLLAESGSTGRQAARAIGLSDKVVRERIDDLRSEKLVVYTQAGVFGDFEYALTEAGRVAARERMASNRYDGPAPVTLQQYTDSVLKQSVSTVKPSIEDLRFAFDDLLIDDAMLQRLGPAVTAGKGCFFFGPPGNGKTSIAERVTRAYGSPVYIPYAVKIGGQTVKVFDPAVHRRLDKRLRRMAAGEDKIDGRWVLCERPTIIVGGELTLNQLEITFDERTGMCEAPVQMKANCGTLVVDDFGRQTITPAQLLNRWIVPMERRVDHLNVPGGRKAAVPFDTMLVFATNLDPRELVDDAFLRRIPYKVHIADPELPMFRDLFYLMAKKLELEVDDGALKHLVTNHFKDGKRPLRMCYPRDLLLQVKNIVIFRKLPPRVTAPLLDEAVDLYFSVV